MGCSESKNIVEPSLDPPPQEREKEQGKNKKTEVVPITSKNAKSQTDELPQNLPIEAKVKIVESKNIQTKESRNGVSKI